jgi:hypothetical protein
MPEMYDGVASHCRQIERCNQRGGRMLSIVDLVVAGTFNVDLAAYALAAIGGGASFMVGAQPGRAGKTTVMGALLNFVPSGVELAVADGAKAITEGLRRPTPRRCFICHEIGDKPFYAYLWGEELRAFFALTSAGHMLATNLHADSYQQTFNQVCRDNGVPEEAFARMNLMLFLSVSREGSVLRRRVEEVWESDGKGRHRQVYSAWSGKLDGSALAGKDEIEDARRTIAELLACGHETIDHVRSVVVSRRDEKGTL